MSSSKDDKTSKKNKKFKGKSGKSPDEAAGIDTRLHHADSAHHVIKYLRDTPPDLTDANGDAPVHVYVKRKDKHKFECLMTFLVHTNCIIDLVNRDGMTALHLACESNDILSAKALIAFDANLNLVNFDNCTPLDIATSFIAPMLVELDAMSAKTVQTIERQESKEYYATHNDLSLSNELSSPSFEPPPFSDIHNTVRTRFGFNSQLFGRLNDLDLNESSVDQTNNISPVLVTHANEGLEFHDGREEEKSVLHDERTEKQGQGEETQTKPNPPIVLESLPEEEQPRAPHQPRKKDRFITPDASVEMALTEVSIMLAKENADPLSPNSSVTSGTSVLRKNPFLMSPSPLSITPHSPASPLEDSHEEEEEKQQEEEKEVRTSEVTPKDLALAYGDIYSPKISPGEQSPYQPVRNPFSLDLLDEDEVQTDTNGVKKAQHSEHKTVHFAESPSPEHERHLFSYTHLGGSIYNQFEEDTKKRMYEAVDSSLGDEGYAAWLQWKEMERAKKWREELNKGLDSEDTSAKKQTSDGQHTIGHKTTPITNGRHSPPPTDPRSKPPQNLPLQGNTDENPPPKPPRKHHTDAAAAAGTKRKVQTHLKQYRRIQSPTSSVYPSIVNPHMAVYQSILGSSIAPIVHSAGEEKGEKVQSHHRRMQSPASGACPSIVNPHMADYQSILGSSVAPIVHSAGEEKGEKVQSHLKLYRRLQSPTSSVHVCRSIVNPRVAVYKSILGSSVAPILLGAGKEKGERILCLDGGGIKGLIQIEILKCIESIAGKPITELFDWIVGTSTGGIVALGLVYANRSLDDMKRMYFELKDTVFKKKSKIISYACDTEALEELLIKTLGSELTMRSATKPKVLITAVDKTTTRLPLVFFNNCFDNEFSDQPVWKVARYTSAAPLYFKELDNYVDGGVVANNPCDYALAEIQDYLRKPKSESAPGNPKRPKPTKPAKNIACVVSIGCGIYPAEPIGNTDILDAMKLTKITAAPHRLKHLVTLLTSALSKSDDVARICQSNCEQLEIPFYRFSPRLGEEVGTAETDNEKLCDIIIGAKKLLVESEDHLLNLVEHLGCKLTGLGREPL